MLPDSPPTFLSTARRTIGKQVLFTHSASKEDAWAALVAHRSQTGRPLMHARQLSPEDRERVEKVSDIRELRSFSEALNTFFSYGTPRFIVIIVAISSVTRVSLSPLTWSDALTAIIIVSFWLVQEWFLHGQVLHSEAEWTGEAIHRFHHDLPYYQVSIDGLDLACVWLSVFIALAMAVSPSYELASTAILFYTLMGGIYEFVHFIAHTRVPLKGYLARVRRHHLKHHIVSKENWLAFTWPYLDSIIGSAHKADVAPEDASHFDDHGEL